MHSAATLARSASDRKLEASNAAADSAAGRALASASAAASALAKPATLLCSAIDKKFEPSAWQGRGGKASYGHGQAGG